MRSLADPPPYGPYRDRPAPNRWPGPPRRSGGLSGLDEPLDERQGAVGDFPPTAVDREGMAAVWNLDDLGHAFVALLALERGVGDRPRHRVVLLAVDDQQRPALGVLGVDLGLGPRIEVRARRLKQRLAGGRHGERLIQLLCLVLAHRVGEREAKLLVGKRYRTVAVRRIAEHGRCGPQRRE